MLPPFARTECACAQRTECCNVIPGMLIPADVERIYRQENVFTYARSHWLASAGAIVQIDDTITRIPTIVPARQANGACKFLTANNLCGIHTSAPFGCAYNDTHMPYRDGLARSRWAISEVYNDRITSGIYTLVWEYLACRRLFALPPEVARDPERRKRALNLA
jgi:hypothetical protein